MRDIILLHQCGKVASATLHATLKANHPQARVVHCHFAADAQLLRFQRMVQHPMAGPRFRASLTEHLHTGLRMRSLLAKADPRRISVITGFRDPLQRAVSAFFQGIDRVAPHIAKAAAPTSERVDQAIELFNDAIDMAPAAAAVDPRLNLARWLVVDSSLHWFRREYMPVHGVDLHALPLSNKDVAVHTANDVRHVVYRFEALAGNPKALRRVLRFAGLDCPVRVDRNTAGRRKGGELYAAFKKKFVPSRKHRKLFYDSPFHNHFYGDTAATQGAAA